MEPLIGAGLDNIVITLLSDVSGNTRRSLNPLSTLTLAPMCVDGRLLTMARRNLAARTWMLATSSLVWRRGLALVQ